MELRELLDWHLMNGKECLDDNEQSQASFHFEAVSLLTRELEKFEKEREMGNW
jgi:hypothetical protein